MSYLPEALRLVGHRTIHACPWCSWSVLHDGMDPEGVEEAIRDHLDTYHDGWTVFEGALREAVSHEGTAE